MIEAVYYGACTESILPPSYLAVREIKLPMAESMFILLMGHTESYLNPEVFFFSPKYTLHKAHK